MLSLEALQTILGIQEAVLVDEDDMAGALIVTFYPFKTTVSKELVSFSNLLKESLERLNAKIIPYGEIWEEIPLIKRLRRFIKFAGNNVIWFFRKIFNRDEINFYLPFSSIKQFVTSKRIKTGISIICIGEQTLEDLPMQYIKNFKTNSVITIVDFPTGIDQNSKFSDHFDTSMSLFAYHMTNIVLAVDASKWMIYNFNASHPIYPLDKNRFDKDIAKALIPKLVAPISPHKLTEFEILKGNFDINEKINQNIILEMQIGGKLFESAGLYPPGKKIEDLPFRHPLHQLIGRMHLDHRNGMSFGFIAFQLPVKIPELVPLDWSRRDEDILYKDKDKDFYVDDDGKISVLININNTDYVLKVPDVWVMTLRSGSNKTNFDPNKDLIKLGLIDGEMRMQFPVGVEVNNTYKPSFDTKVILAHAIGNAILAGVMKHSGISNPFVNAISEKGVSITHWHGYLNSEKIPRGIYLYGRDNPHVSCSSPQSAIYALDGKLKMLSRILNSNDMNEYSGDAHIEPHHGINISYFSLVNLAKYIVENPHSTELGNKYL